MLLTGHFKGLTGYTVQVKNMDHNTGYAMQVPLDGLFLMNSHLKTFLFPREGRSPQQQLGHPWQLNKVKGSLKSPSAPLGGHNYPYDCYNVNIEDPAPTH